jgi:hypothetical protein
MTFGGSMFKKNKRGYLWVTLIFFLISFAGHWVFAWFAFVNDQKDHNRQPEVSAFVIETSRDMLENWQSEFLQLIWQVGGLAAFLYVGSPQSKEGDERKEEKLDIILRKLDPANADSILSQLEQKYPKS